MLASFETCEDTVSGETTLNVYVCVFSIVAFCTSSLECCILLESNTVGQEFLKELPNLNVILLCFLEIQMFTSEYETLPNYLLNVYIKRIRVGLHPQSI